MVACGPCYEDISKNLGGFCPLDGERIDDDNFTRPNKSLAREISKIKVKCFHENCDWKGALNDIEVRFS